MCANKNSNNEEQLEARKRVKDAIQGDPTQKDLLGFHFEQDQRNIAKHCLLLCKGGGGVLAHVSYTGMKAPKGMLLITHFGFKMGKDVKHLDL